MASSVWFFEVQNLLVRPIYASLPFDQQVYDPDQWSQWSVLSCLPWVAHEASVSQGACVSAKSSWVLSWRRGKRRVTSEFALNDIEEVCFFSISFAFGVFLNLFWTIFCDSLDFGGAGKLSWQPTSQRRPSPFQESGMWLNLGADWIAESGSPWVWWSMSCHSEDTGLVKLKMTNPHTGVEMLRRDDAHWTNKEQSLFVKRIDERSPHGQKDIMNI